MSHNSVVQTGSLLFIYFRTLTLLPSSSSTSEKPLGKTSLILFFERRFTLQLHLCFSKCRRFLCFIFPIRFLFSPIIFFMFAIFSTQNDYICFSLLYLLFSHFLTDNDLTLVSEKIIPCDVPLPHRPVKRWLQSIWWR